MNHKNHLARLMILSLCIVGVFACAKKEEKKPLHPKVEKLKLPPGFVAEHIYSPGENEQGSWVAMTFDPKGRMITADQYGSLYRLDIPAIGSDSLAPKVEKLVVGNQTDQKLGMGYAQGLLYAFNSVYVMVNHRGNDEFERTTGMYRIQDLDGDDQYETVTLIKLLEGDPGEHGPHSMILSPDGQSIYISAGNHVDVPEMDAYRLPRVWDRDNLFPEIKDPRGHANNRMAPGGWIAKTDPEGKSWELIAAGFRNEFDIAFNENGDLFTYDSDMEWDFGMPWYRPTRICYVPSGAEFGWRTGNQKWSPNYPDNLPAALNIGQGSPTNVMFGTNSKFPEKYKKALYTFDWSFGIIYATTLTPEGAAYAASAEEFISGSPLPLTDGEFGPDGSMYFLTGGRRLESDLYRVYYDGDEEAGTETKQTLTEEHLLRRKMEEFHVGGPKAGAVEAAWPNLAHSDRFVQYAARIAVEHQPVSEWQAKVLSESDPNIAIQGAIALARHGDASVATPLLDKLTSIDYDELSETGKQNLLRAIELTLFRFENSSKPSYSKVVTFLDPKFPSGNNNLDRELAKLLAHTGAPDAVSKIVSQLETAKDDESYQKTFTSSSDLIMRNPQYGMDIANMLANVPPAQQTYYAVVLGGAEKGWTPELHDQYFTWIRNAFNYKGGRSYVGFIDRARKMALTHVSNAETSKYDEMSGAALLTGNGNDIIESDVQPEGPGRRWTVEEAAPMMDNLAGRDFVKGKAMFQATLCQSCHTMQGEGGVIGPDLTQLGTRFSAKDILEATIDPSAVISDQYAATALVLKDGNSVVGRITNEDNANYYVSQNPFAPQTIRTVPKSDVVETKLSEVSIMLPGMINRLNEEELKDLMAYLISGGNPDHEVFKGAPAKSNPE
ncbi:c-type cytochrome [Algoriphagus pacificus]|uniref:C-type cytochrome n=1 Tax=Algoriphagus pacificus TaxID=2811234 RepID=A0ABS3CIV9_9BACT|nr:c-type cytochrome [Algoriphagus pacificus]MBN7817032.1 c-type cytochrome [Algoriphagus pacificus]